MTQPVKIPPSWQPSPKIQTLSDLKSHRRSLSIPHSSFDLDGDGIVGSQDLVIASRFDHDKDGKLSPSERAQALKALSEGYSNNFMWGCESSGLNRSFRIVQKRGKVIANEDFTVLRDTYPEQQVNERMITKSELEMQRKMDDRREARINEGRVNCVTSKLVPIESFLCKDMYVEKPLYCSVNEKKSVELKSFRERAGLSGEAKDLRGCEVRYEYAKSPENWSLTEMKMRNRESLVKMLNENADYSHTTFYAKVENEKNYVGPNGRMLKDILIERKIKDANHLEEIFVQKIVGIHGKELPKFEDSVKYSESNSQTSSPYLNAFADYHKEYHKIEDKIEEVAMKPTQITHNIFATDTKNKINSKFSEYYSQFMPRASISPEIYHEHQKLGKIIQIEKKQFKFLKNLEITPPITQRLLNKIASPHPKFKSITSSGFSYK